MELWLKLARQHVFIFLTRWNTHSNLLVKNCQYFQHAETFLSFIRDVWHMDTRLSAGNPYATLLDRVKLSMVCILSPKKYV